MYEAFECKNCLAIDTGSSLVFDSLPTDPKAAAVSV